VTGLDFSSASLAVAREVAAEAGVRARFVEADVHDAVEALARHRFRPGAQVGQIHQGPATGVDDVERLPGQEGATVSHLWAHSVVEVIGALHAAGLTPDPDMLWETDWVNEPRWNGMVPMAPGWWRRPAGGVRIPLMYALGARRSK
jgi:hypothetical protein